MQAKHICMCTNQQTSHFGKRQKPPPLPKSNGPKDKCSQTDMTYHSDSIQHLKSNNGLHIRAFMNPVAFISTTQHFEGGNVKYVSCWLKTLVVVVVLAHWTIIKLPQCCFPASKRRLLYKWDHNKALWGRALFHSGSCAFLLCSFPLPPAFLFLPLDNQPAFSDYWAFSFLIDPFKKGTPRVCPEARLPCSTNLGLPWGFLLPPTSECYSGFLT